MSTGTLAATDGVGAERIEIVGERGLPMRRSFAFDWSLNLWFLGRRSVRRLGLSHSLIHRWRYQTRVMAGVQRNWQWCAVPRDLRRLGKRLLQRRRKLNGLRF